FKGFICHEDEGQVIKEIEKEITVTDEKSEAFVEFFKKNKKGYSIEKLDEKIIVGYSDRTELCRALLKLISAEEIKDKTEGEKCFSDFGIMLDTSRNAVPKVETVKKMIRLCALMGYKFVGLYMEDTLKLPDEPYWGYQRGAYTCEEIKELDCYAKIFDVELRPFVQTLAHINQVVRYQRYKEAIDADDIFLIGDKETERIIDKILKTVSLLFSTRKINIGMDEAYLVGRGRYIDKNGYRPRAKIMREHLNMVLEKCKKYNLNPQMWGDMFFDFAPPEALLDKEHDYEVPEGVEICYWDYYSTDSSHYEKRLQAHFALTDKVAFAGGAWKWSGFAPHNKFSTEANRVAVETCKKFDIDSYTVTCWGDNGAECSTFAVLPTLFETANFVYGDGMTGEAFKAVTGISISDFNRLDDVNPYMEKNASHNNACKYLLFEDILFGTFDSCVKEDTVAEFETAKEKIQNALTGGNKFADLFLASDKLLEVLLIKATLGLDIRKAYESGNKQKLKEISSETIPELIKRIDDYYRIFKKQWYSENKQNGFEVQAVRFGGLKRRLEDVSETIDEYVEGKANSIEVLEEKRQDFAYYDYDLGHDDISNLNYNLWSNIVSPAVIG
ncbi:MAG: beta-N-acetylhexosaminidase, partial [Lachnospiraceae bacterium]|nr:beta-N-acetylhexosaminidase [Lachnospiraceae bacterium]